jgi:very-short-patch-repair endonuclease
MRKKKMTMKEIFEAKNRKRIGNRSKRQGCMAFYLPSRGFRGEKWFSDRKRHRRYRADFYSEKTKIIIEYAGHPGHETSKLRDACFAEWCAENGFVYYLIVSEKLLGTIASLKGVLQNVYIVPAEKDDENNIAFELQFKKAIKDAGIDLDVNFSRDISSLELFLEGYLYRKIFTNDELAEYSAEINIAGSATMTRHYHNQIKQATNGLLYTIVAPVSSDHVKIRYSTGETKIVWNSQFYSGKVGKPNKV